jgi:hypothetical protein
MKVIKTIQNSSYKLLKNIKTICKTELCNILFSAHEAIRPTAILAHPLGPAAQQPTGWPPKRPAHRACLGQIWPANRRLDGRPSALLGRSKPAALAAPPANPSPLSFFPLLSDPHRRRRVKCLWPSCPPAMVRSSAARPEAADVSPLSFLLKFSFPLCLCRALAAAGLSSP